MIYLKKLSEDVYIYFFNLIFYVSPFFFISIIYICKLLYCKIVESAFSFISKLSILEFRGIILKNSIKIINFAYQFEYITNLCINNL